MRDIAKNLVAYPRRDNGVNSIIEDIWNAGVLFTYVPHFEKTYTDGASFWHGANPVLAYTARYDRIDNFWFTVAHELGHILLHEGKETSEFVDSLDNLKPDDDLETEADDFAKRVLRIPEILRAFEGIRRVSRKQVDNCAYLLGLHPGVVVGALQRAGRLNYQSLNALKEPVRELLPGSFGQNAT